ncbi:cytochrome P450 [Syncephalis plumigaleata]|nr:cytochrome P450 [Syncephalis plumigaleata]
MSLTRIMMIIHISILTLLCHYQLIEQEYLSPLAKIPGPRPAMLGAFISDMKRAISLQRADVAEMHERYGPIVRIGPNTLWVSSSSSIRKVNGTHQYIKGSDYERARTGEANVFNTRDADYHRIRKRLMIPAFTPNALNDLEPLIYDVGLARLITRIDEYADAGTSFDLMDLLKNMTFDTIGEVGFGKSFGLLDEKREQHPIIQWMNSRLLYGSFKIIFGKLFSMNMLPKLAKNIKDLDDYALQAIAKRRKQGDLGRKDTLQQLIESVDEATGERLTDQSIMSEVLLLMIAGTDTTALTMTWTMNFLLQYPETFKRLAEEVRSFYPDPDTRIAYKDVLSMKYLDAVLHESMRIRPIAPHGMPRIIAEGGTMLDGYFVPGGTTVMVSIGVMHMNEEVFPEPHVFRPERWIDSSADELAKMKLNFAPFSVGPRACLGRNLAWMELRMTIAELARRFTFEASSKNDMTPLFRGPTNPKGGKFIVQAHRA